MIVSIHQPQYFLWLGLLDKIAKSDLFVYLDSVQFQRGGYQNRAVYSTPEGIKYLTIPVKAENHLENEVKINEIKFADLQERILKKHYETLRHRYSHSDGWNIIGDKIYEFFCEKEYANVCDMIINSMELTMSVFGIETKRIKASELSACGRKDELVLEIVKKTGGNIYLSGKGAKSYMREEIFEESDIKVLYQDFIHPIYKQRNCDNFFDGCMALEFFLDDQKNALNYIEKLKRSNLR